MVLRFAEEAIFYQKDRFPEDEVQKSAVFNLVHAYLLNFQHLSNFFAFLLSFFLAL